jgi:aspartyl-tRNA(Asn)/glutamyl-tRNA(Gln) amidotransferase subunit A
MSLHTLTLDELSARLRDGATTAAEITENFVERARAHNGTLNAFVEIYTDDAIRLAEACDRARRSGFPVGPLHGLPFAVKDLFHIAGRRGGAGSRMWSERVATDTAAAVERLLAAGMIPIGKTQMVEFAYGGWGHNPLLGTPHNPWDLATHRVPGGSSSGSGVAVAAGFAPAALGSDTGGSVRTPAAFNGVVGLKVTFGRIGLRGTDLLSWTLDTVGPICRSVTDCALLLEVLAGPDPRDPATLIQPFTDFAGAVRNASARHARIAMPPAEQLPDFMHPAVTAAWQEAGRRLAALGAIVEQVPLPDRYFDLSQPATTIIASEAFTLHHDWIEDERNPIGPAVRQRVLRGKTIAAQEYAGALRRMERDRSSFAEWFEPFDAILLPTVGIPAPPVTEADEATPIPGYFTRPANFLGLCAISLPCGFAGGLPLSIQLVGKPYAEATILRLARAFEASLGPRPDLPKLAATA